MKKKLLVLSAASMAAIALASLTSCSESNSVDLTYRDAQGETSTLTVSATSDKTQVAKIIEAVSYTASVSDSTIDATSFTVGAELSGQLKAETSESGTGYSITADNSISLEGSAAVTLSLPETAESYDNLITGLGLSGNLNYKSKLVGNSTYSSTETTITNDSSYEEELFYEIYNGSDRVFLDATINSNTTSNGVSNASSSSEKGYILKTGVVDSDDLSFLTELGLDEENFETSYASMYAKLKEFNLYESLLDIDGDDTTYNTVDEFLEDKLDMSLEEVVEDYGITVSDVSNGAIYFGVEVAVPLSSTESFTINATIGLKVDGMIPYSLSASINEQANAFLGMDLSYAKGSITVDFGTAVNTLTDTSEYTKDLSNEVNLGLGF